MYVGYVVKLILSWTIPMKIPYTYIQYLQYNISAKIKEKNATKLR